MHIRQIIINTYEGGEVSECRWVAQLTPTEERVQRSFSRIYPAMGAMDAWVCVMNEEIDTLMHKFPDMEWHEAEAYMGDRIDERLFNYLRTGECPHQADTVEAA